jgi:ribosome maturation factor RimP
MGPLASCRAGGVEARGAAVQGGSGTVSGTVEGRVAELAEAQAAPLGLAVLEVAVTAARPPVVQVIVDVAVADRGRVDDDAQPTSVDIDAIAVLSRTLGDLLTTSGITPDDATLEVSSPGIDRRLRDAHDLVRNLGRELEVHLHDEEAPAVRGRLLVVDGEALELAVAGRRGAARDVERIELAAVAYALPVLPW